MLKKFRTKLNELNIRNSIVTDKAKSDYSIGRIALLSKLRNKVIEPMFTQPQKFEKLLFINDVYLCLDDIIELIYQARFQNSDITCGFDFERDGREDTKHYDIWVSRSISGNLLRDVSAHEAFYKDPLSRDRYNAGLPIQTFSCWGGMALINTAPFYKHGVRFRSGKEGECRSSECLYLSKDFWKLGYGKVLMVFVI